MREKSQRQQKLNFVTIQNFEELSNHSLQILKNTNDFQKKKNTINH